MKTLADLPPPKGSEAEDYYPDPLGGKHGRWWDGSQWTSRVGPKMAPGSVPEVWGQAPSSATPPAGDIRPDVQAAMGRMQVTIGGRRELRKLDEHLWHDEEVEEITTGYYGGGTGLILLTDRRLLFFRDGWVGKTSEDFPRDKVSSVQFSSGLLLGKITVFASGNRAEIANVNKNDGKRIVDNMRARLSAPHPKEPQAATRATVRAEDPLAQITKLGELRVGGVITEEEFEAKKAELLSRL